VKQTDTGPFVLAFFIGFIKGTEPSSFHDDILILEKDTPGAMTQLGAISRSASKN
jgi:hypothetical protein